MAGQDRCEALLRLLPHLAPALHAFVDPANQPPRTNNALTTLQQSVEAMLPEIEAICLQQKEESTSSIDVTRDQLKQWAREGSTDQIRKLPVKLQIEYYKLRADVLRNEKFIRDSRRDAQSIGLRQNAANNAPFRPPEIDPASAAAQQLKAANVKFEVDPDYVDARLRQTPLRRVKRAGAFESEISRKLSVIADNTLSPELYTTTLEQCVQQVAAQITAVRDNHTHLLRIATKLALAQFDNASRELARKIAVWAQDDTEYDIDISSTICTCLGDDPAILSYHKFQDVLMRTPLLRSAVMTLDVMEYEKLVPRIEKPLPFTACITCYAPDFLLELPGITAGLIEHIEEEADVYTDEDERTVTESSSAGQSRGRVLRSQALACSLMFSDNGISRCKQCRQSRQHVCRQLCREHRGSLLTLCYHKDRTKRKPEEVLALLGQQAQCKDCVYRHAESAPGTDRLDDEGDKLTYLGMSDDDDSDDSGPDADEDAVAERRTTATELLRQVPSAAGVVTEDDPETNSLEEGSIGKKTKSKAARVTAAAGHDTAAVGTGLDGTAAKKRGRKMSSSPSDAAAKPPTKKPLARKLTGNATSQQSDHYESTIQRLTSLFWRKRATKTRQNVIDQLAALRDQMKAKEQDHLADRIRKTDDLIRKFQDTTNEKDQIPRAKRGEGPGKSKAKKGDEQDEVDHEDDANADGE